MPRRFSPFVLMAYLVIVSAALTASDKDFVGKWSGDYEGGGGAGKYVLTLAHDDAKKLAGSLEVLPDGNSAYTVPFKSVEPKGSTALLKYDSPEGNSEVHVEITIDGKALKGTWKALEPGSNAVIAEGTLTGAKN